MKGYQHTDNSTYMEAKDESMWPTKSNIYSASAPCRIRTEVYLAHEKHMLPDVLFHERKVHPGTGCWALHALLSFYSRATRGFLGLQVREHAC